MKLSTKNRLGACLLNSVEVYVGIMQSMLLAGTETCPFTCATEYEAQNGWVRNVGYPNALREKEFIRIKVEAYFWASACLHMKCRTLNNRYWRMEETNMVPRDKKQQKGSKMPLSHWSKACSVKRRTTTQRTHGDHVVVVWTILLVRAYVEGHRYTMGAQGDVLK